MLNLSIRKGVVASFCAVTLAVVFSACNFATPDAGSSSSSGTPTPTATTYRVTYDGNGSTGGAAPVDAKTYATGEKATVLAAPATLVKGTSVFSGWNTQADGLGALFKAGDSLTIASANVTLYAFWTATGTPVTAYSVVYNGNGSTAGAVPADGATYVAGATVTLYGNIGALAKTGNTFAGWTTVATGAGPLYAAGATMKMASANITLYAVWAADGTTVARYKIAYDGNGNTSGTAPVDSASYATGAYVTVPGNTGNLAKTGLYFAGWNTKADGTGTTLQAGATIAMGSTAITLYAMWSSTATPTPTPVSTTTFTVTYKISSDATGSVPVDSQTYAAGANVTVLGNTGNLAKTGYTLYGWNTAADGTGTTYFPGNTFVMGSANVSLYAAWTIASYKVIYDGNGNTGGYAPSYASSYSYYAGYDAYVLDNTGPYVKTGYTFSGWNTKADGTGTTYKAGDSFKMGATDITLYALWVLNTYKVTYNGNDSTGGSVPVDSGSYNSGATVTVLGNTGNVVNAGYAFNGWNTKADGTGTAYAVGSTFKMGDANTVLYAMWKFTSGGVTTFAGGGTGSYPTNGNTDGTGKTALLMFPQGLAIDSSGNLYVGEYGRIRKLTPAGVSSKLASGFGQETYTAVDSSGNVYVSDTYNHKIKKISTSGDVTVIAGSGTQGHADGAGAAATFNYPRGLAFDSSGNLYVTDWGYHLIRKITPAGVVTTFAGGGTVGGTANGHLNATGTNATFAAPCGIVIDSSNNLYVVEESNNDIRKITPAGVVTTFVGGGATGYASGHSDGTGTTATFTSPEAITMDASGNFYVTDCFYGLIRKITSGGVVTTIAGGGSTGTNRGYANGVGSAALFYNPFGIARDSSGVMYIADYNNHLIRRIEP